MSSSSGKGMVGKYEIEKFNGKSDFSYWKLQIKSLLVSQRLHKALEGKDKKPDTMKDEAWEETDGEACATILLCLERDVAFEVKEETTAKGMWKSYLKTRVYKCKMLEGGNLRDHIREFERIISDLKDVDVTVEDDDQAFLLRLSLPKSYEGLVQTIMLMALLQDELRKLTTGSMGSGEVKEEMTHPRVYTLSQVAQHHSTQDCWFIINGSVLDVTNFLEDHPGGAEVLMESVEKDATKEFDTIGHSKAAQTMLRKYQVGVLEGFKFQDARNGKEMSFEESRGKEMTGHVIKQQNWSQKYSKYFEFLVPFLVASFLYGYRVATIATNV